MNTQRFPYTPSEVRLKLDNLIAHVERRSDETEAALGFARGTAEECRAELLHEHQLGRLHGLQEAKELLDLLDGGL